MRVAIAQICTSRDIDANLELVREYTRRAGEAGASLVVFPEATMRAFGHNLTEIAEPLDGPFASAIRQFARDCGLTVVVGMFTPGIDGRVRNTLLVTGPDGDTAYDKIHLFDAFGFSESDTVTAGSTRAQLDVGGVRLGFATCYDVRFPQLFIENARDGAQVQIVSASWGDGPGKREQWQLLTRARALDSTSFVVACGQARPSAAGVEAKPGAPTGIGFSAVISPDGQTLAEAGAGVKLLIADLDLETVDSVRSAIPVLTNAKLS